MRKRIWWGLKDCEAARLLGRTPGAEIQLSMQMYKESKRITGTIMVKLQTPHGTMFLIKNKYYWDWRNKLPNPHPRSEAFAWDIIPIWASQCGQSGIPNNMHAHNIGGIDPDYAAAMKLLHYAQEELARLKAIEQDRQKREAIGILAGVLLRFLEL